MRLDIVKAFRDSTNEMLQQIVGPVEDAPAMAMHPTPLEGRDVTAVIELDGEARGRVIFDMDSGTAMRIAGRLLEEPPPVMTPMAQSAISELASMIIGHAISAINDRGTRVDMEPPLFGGADSARPNVCFETLTFPVQTLFGEVRVNVMIHDLD
jgi:chemotaxis protein CheX